ncbi:MAG: FG-GAP repeat domain-containing protein, partial [Bryobacteraceae bacterium]
MIRSPLLGAFLVVLLAAGALLLGQGMGSSVRAVPRGSPKARLDRPLPPLAAADAARASGLAADHVYGGIDSNKYILEMTGNGVAVFDFDGDGWRDLFFVNGTRLGAAAPAPHKLYRNSGNGRFDDATAASGIVNRGWGQGVCAGDYDNDGFTDLLVTYYGHNVLYRNLGKGRFEDVTRQAGL